MTTGSPPAWLGPTLVAVACGVTVAVLQGTDPGAVRSGEVSSVAVSEEALEMLELRPGERLVGWTVLGIDGPTDGKTRVDFGRDDNRLSITIVPLGTSQRSAPLSTERHALYYGHVQPADSQAPAGAVRALLHRLADRVRRYEQRRHP